MNRVVVHHQNGTIRLCVSLDGAEVAVNPELGKSVDAVAMRIAKKLRRPEASFVDADGGAVEGDCTKLETGHQLKFPAEFTLLVFVNPPLVRDLAVPAYPMVGLPMLPNVLLEHSEAADWRWLRGGVVVGSERVYVPTASDEGFRLLCECTPLQRRAIGSSNRWGARSASPLPDAFALSVSAESDVVRAAPQFIVSAISPQVCAGDFRVLSYNLLADYNLKPDMARGDPFYVHLTPEERDFSYRRQLLLREISGFSADILCLQEVDRDSMFGNFLQGQLGHLGYDGLHANKVHTSTPVGNAVFWRRASWRLLASEALDLTRGEAIQSLLEACPSLGLALGKTTTVANLVVLEDKAGHRVVVANLHLFGDPGAPHIRLLQTYLVLRAAERHKAPLLLCGDFNCGSESGVCELLTVGFVDEGHPDWSVGRGFEWGALGDKRADLASVPQDQWCAAMCLNHSSALRTAGVPDYTYWNGLRGYVVDHVFLDAAALRVQSLLPVPPLAFIQKHGVASSACPSDHAALVADLCWN
ncbi:unnamed protein product [Polarella glacialis]|uniref:Endonuclease/exonuclease/phosphatase domain-containing protein n=1 Tax=Polarella glacialis TaxID=89957 RepID=A0A813LVJ6_POLGL|nr:unnamed protein product [Polarella glacialis]